MNRQAAPHLPNCRQGFATPELLFVIAALALVLVLCLPILEAMRAGRLSLLGGSLLIAAICLLFLIPWIASTLSERSWRRRMEAREQDEQDQKKIS